MELRRLKTIIILILLLVMTAGIVSYAQMEQNDRSINRDYENRIISMLDDAHISIDRALISHGGGFARNLYIELADCGGEEFVTSVLGSGYTKTDRTVFAKDGKRLTLTDDGAVLTSGGEALQAGRERERCTALLSSLGVDIHLYKLSGIQGGQSEDGTYAARYSAYYEDCEIFDSYIDVVINEESTTVTFKNPISLCRSTEGTSAFFSGASILAELPQNPMFEGVERATVTEIRRGAAIASDGQNIKSVFAIPVWRVTTDGAGVMMYDARNGNFLQ